MVDDSRETTNRFDNPALAQEKSQLQIALMKWLQETSDIAPFVFDHRFTEESMWSKLKPVVPTGYEEDVRQKNRSGMGIGALFGYRFSLRR